MFHERLHARRFRDPVHDVAEAARRARMVRADAADARARRVAVERQRDRVGAAAALVVLAAHA